MYLKNLTPHPIVFHLEGGATATLAPEPVSLRLDEEDVAVSKEWVQGEGGVFPNSAGNTRVEGWEPEGIYQLALPVVKRTYSAPEDLPAPEDGVLLVVSLPALMGLRAAGITRADIVSLDTGPGPFGAVRNEAGVVVGSRALLVLGEFPEGLYGGDGWPAATWLEAQTKNVDLPGEYAGDR